MSELKRTPLFAEHLALNAKMIPFGGWEMPVQYSAILQEHRSVREQAGLFDLSHMGEFFVSGPGAYDYLQRLLTNNLAKLLPGKAQYNLLCNEAGGVIDDLIVYCYDQERYLVVVNAANIGKDWEWFTKHLPSSGVTLTDRSAETALLAVQGPKSEEILRPLCSEDPAQLKFYSFVEGTVAGRPAMISATGYTGERGFELYIDAADAGYLWQELLQAGRESGLVPVGLGARDTLRLEMAYPLYGQELSEDITPWEAGLGWTVKLDKGDFIGKEALVAKKEAGLTRSLVGFKMIGRGVCRHGYEILNDDAAVIGSVTSGSFSPTLEENIGLGYVTLPYTEPGTRIWVKIREKLVEAQVVALPFVQPYTKRA
ncbi:MAG: glycine cleavage system aminomethyltransferase GcvT [Firmicutes bacterium]|nr:glycine cleavage system aminomethyltransferase GcvT [Bacillota bacterium]